MDDNERQNIDVVRIRLIQRFPNLEPGVVEDLIEATLHRFDDCRIRDFVPLLVERSATRTLDAVYCRAPMLPTEPLLVNEEPDTRSVTSSGKVWSVFARRSPRLS
ncbi:three-helix bundle dimerization domain-containing protein [Rhodococcus sp. NPDC019627]|uniref:three-helix bundle dimerization domain-containing protein n=1 Tax=unclassified Rhodococcus (in: high G+C Gram-positive bacteria) TaxID=192944 RepID=UPI0033CAFC0D